MLNINLFFFLEYYLSIIFCLIKIANLLLDKVFADIRSVPVISLFDNNNLLKKEERYMQKTSKGGGRGIK